MGIDLELYKDGKYVAGLGRQHQFVNWDEPDERVDSSISYAKEKLLSLMSFLYGKTPGEKEMSGYEEDLDCLSLSIDMELESLEETLIEAGKNYLLHYILEEDGMEIKTDC